MANELAAEDIAEDLLYRSGRGLFSGRFDDFLVCFSVPNVIETVEGKRLLETEEDIRAVYDEVRAYYVSVEVTDVARTVISAEFLDRNTVGSTHVSRLLREGGIGFRKPFPVYSIIRRFEHSWKCVSSIYAILDAPRHNDALCFANSRNLSRASWS